MNVKGSSCVIVNNDYCVYAKQEFPIEELETTPHAPIQALILARKQEVEGGTAYISKFPCYVCAKALAAAGIKKIVYKESNNSERVDEEKSLKILNLSKIEVVRNENLEV